MKPIPIVISLIIVLASGLNLPAEEQTQTPQKYAVFGFAFTYGYGVSPMELKVCAVRPGSPADSAGLREADVIEEVDGAKDFKNSLAVLSYILTKRPGEALELRVRRNQSSLTVAPIGVEATEEQVAAILEIVRLAEEEAESHRR